MGITRKESVIIGLGQTSRESRKCDVVASFLDTRILRLRFRSIVSVKTLIPYLIASWISGSQCRVLVAPL